MKDPHHINSESIKIKLIKLGMIVSTVAVVLTGLVIFSYGIFQAREALVKELRLTANIASESIAPGLVWEDNSLVRSSLELLEVKDSILIACVLNTDNQVVIHFPPEESQEQCSKESGEEIQYVGWRFIDVFHEITFDNQVLGTLYIRSDLRELRSSIPQYILFVLAVMLCVIAISYIIAVRYQKRITRPIFNLLETTQYVMDKNDYTHRAKKVSDDEVGLLTASFNKMMATVQDSTENLENKVSERTRELEKEKEKAEEANRAKSEFLRNMSHEFRTPLHGMKAYSGFGMDDYKTAERETLRGHFEKISIVTNRLTGLVEALLSVAQLDSGKQTFNMTSNNLLDSINKVVAEQQSLLDQKNINLELKLPKSTTNADYDDAKIIQVLVNILGNAIKFTQDGKKITITLKKDELGGRYKKAAYRITISDEGVGIPEGELKKIFDKFIQSSRTNDGSGGTGLGLAIASKIVAGHSGKIYAENNKKQGASFIVILPKEQKKATKKVQMV